jgi:hypothetical protein
VCRTDNSRFVGKPYLTGLWKSLPVIRPESKAKGRDRFLLADFSLLIGQLRYRQQ